MSQTAERYDHLPARVRHALEHLCGALRETLADDLLCVALYGGIAKGQAYVAGETRIHLAIVLADANVHHLSRMVPAVQHAVKAHGVVPFVVSLHDLETSTDVFPIKLADMQAHHIALFGNNVFANLKVSDAHLRLRAEQEMKNLLIRLRNGFLRASGDDSQLSRVVAGAVEPLLNGLAAIVSLQTGLKPASHAETVDVAASVLKLDVALLESLLNLYFGGQHVSTSETQSLYGRLLDLVQQVVGTVDGWDTE